ncbi:hypothetical protein EGX73_08905 [Enterococcus sp. FDAARGOS_553]|nr:hypothetical protein EGX73_08905 [Enterococcus sp. FDAARGOS_553]
MGIYQRSKELKIVLFLSEFSNFLPKAAEKPLFLCYFIFSTRDTLLEKLCDRDFYQTMLKIKRQKRLTVYRRSSILYIDNYLYTIQ